MLVHEIFAKQAEYTTCFNEKQIWIIRMAEEVKRCQPNDYIRLIERETGAVLLLKVKTVISASSFKDLNIRSYMRTVKGNINDFFCYLSSYIPNLNTPCSAMLVQMVAPEKMVALERLLAEGHIACGLDGDNNSFRAEHHAMVEYSKTLCDRNGDDKKEHFFRLVDELFSRDIKHFRFKAIYDQIAKIEVSFNSMACAGDEKIKVSDMFIQLFSFSDYFRICGMPLPQKPNPLSELWGKTEKDMEVTSNHTVTMEFLFTIYD